MRIQTHWKGRPLSELSKRELVIIVERLGKENYTLRQKLMSYQIEEEVNAILNPHTNRGSIGK